MATATIAMPKAILLVITIVLTIGDAVNAWVVEVSEGNPVAVANAVGKIRKTWWLQGPPMMAMPLGVMVNPGGRHSLGLLSAVRGSGRGPVTQGWPQHSS